MPKSHGKGRYQPRKKKIMQPAAAAAATAQPAESRQQAGSAPLRAPAPVSRAPSSKAAAALIMQYPYVMSDLIRIGIVAGIIVVILIILALIFS